MAIIIMDIIITLSKIRTVDFRHMENVYPQPKFKTIRGRRIKYEHPHPLTKISTIEPPQQ